MDIIRKVGKAVTPDFLRPIALRAYVGLDRFLHHPAISPLPDNVTDFGASAVFELFNTCRLYLHVNVVDGVYMEFGCYTASTFRYALNTLGRYTNRCSISNFYAFDSFQGMPEPEGIDKCKSYSKGILSTSIENFKKLCRKDLHRTTIIEGYYEDTLKDFNFKPGEAISMAYVDCDYYSSTKCVLDFLKKHLRHAMIVGFDDFIIYYGDPMRGQKKAFIEFREAVKEGFHLEHLATVATGACAFIVLDRKLMGTEFA